MQWLHSYFIHGLFITTRKQSLGQGNMFTGVYMSKEGGCYPSMHYRWYPSMHCSRSLGGLQAHTQGGSGGESGPGPQSRGKLRGIWSRPTAKGEVEGDLVQAHTQGGSWRGSAQGWCLLWGVPAPEGVPGPRVAALGGACYRGCLDLGGWGVGYLVETPLWAATVVGSMHPTGMYSCFSCWYSWYKRHMSHFSYTCKMQYLLNLVLENWEYLLFYWTFCIVILDYGLKLHKLLIHTLVMLQKWLEIH